MAGRRSWSPSRRALKSRPAHVSLASACTGANHVVFGLLLNPGDHVAMETPIYEPLLKLAGYFGAMSTLRAA